MITTNWEFLITKDRDGFHGIVYQGRITKYFFHDIDEAFTHLVDAFPKLLGYRVSIYDVPVGGTVLKSNSEDSRSDSQGIA